MMEKEKKQQLGQFYTTRNNYIFTGFDIPKRVTKFVEPFCGQGDLVDYTETWMKQHRRTISSFELFDIDPKVSMLFRKRQKDVIVRDTIMEPPNYKDKFIVTNPPYRARQRSTNKAPFDKYNESDLFKCFLRTLIIDNDNMPAGGQIIIPLNFISSVRNIDCQIRNDFLKHFDITKMNIFEESVFDDTSYTVCAFQFLKKKDFVAETQNVQATFFPSRTTHQLAFDPAYNNIVGGDVYFLPIDPTIKVRRLIIGDEPPKTEYNFFLTAIDSGINDGDKIGLELSKTVRYGNVTSRAYSTFVVDPVPSFEIQKKICDEFNTMINQRRQQCNSLFLPNYREAKDYSRKRIPFELVYRMINHIYRKYL